jgi:NAD(P)-dependent dehydrogenase (short-subunit alcohol dehydrogenase family)
VLTGAYGALPYLKKTPGSLMFSTSSSSGTYGMPRIAVYSSTKHAVKGLTEAQSVEWQRHGVRVADVHPGLIDTAILTTTINHSDDAGPTMSAEELRAAAPKKGMFRLMPATSVAEAAWQAYHHPRRLQLVRAQEHSLDRPPQGPESGVRARSHHQISARADAESRSEGLNSC